MSKRGVYTCPCHLPVVANMRFAGFQDAEDRREPSSVFQWVCQSVPSSIVQITPEERTCT